MKVADSLGSSALTIEWKYLLLISYPFIVFLDGWRLIRGEREEGGLVRKRPICKIESRRLQAQLIPELASV